jgi:hypothetical protein
VARVHVDVQDLAAEKAEVLGIPIVDVEALRDVERVLRGLLDVPLRIIGVGGGGT